MIDVADLKAWLGNPHGTGISTLLTDLEARAVDLLEAETERHFGASATFTEYLEGHDSAELWLREAPSAITSVHYRLYPGDAWTEITEGDDDGFELRAPKSDSGKAKLIRKGGFVWALGYDYRVIYDFGYTSGAEPGEIRQAVMDLVALKFNERGREGLATHAAGGVSWSVLAKRDVLAVPGLKRVVDRWRGTKAV